MARVELPSGIAAIHGRLGNMVFRSRQQPDGTYKVFVSEYKPKKKVISRKRLDIDSKLAGKTLLGGGRSSQSDGKTLRVVGSMLAGK